MSDLMSKADILSQMTLHSGGVVVVYGLALPPKSALGRTLVRVSARPESPVLATPKEPQHFGDCDHFHPANLRLQQVTVATDQEGCPRRDRGLDNRVVLYVTGPAVRGGPGRDLTGEEEYFIDHPSTE